MIDLKTGLRGAMICKKFATVLLLAVCVIFSPLVQAQGESTGGDNPLLPFQRLIGGQWHLGNSYQEFEWGVGRQSVKARSYFVIDGEPMLVGEGTWYWHPQAKVIRGAFTAIEMPVALFEYETRFEGNTMTSLLAAYDAAGARTAYVERWRFLDDERFEWTLLRETDDELLQEMQGTYVRTP